MAREKATITVDRAKVDAVRALMGAQSTSQTIDLALAEVIRLDRLRRDIEGYTKVPPTPDEVALAAIPHDWAELADDTDWDALYAEDES